MRANRILLSTLLVLLALIVQVSVLARLQLPGAVPDLLLLTVLGLAMVYGHTGGALIGFAAGLLADVAPPADHAVGRYALVLCLVGYAAGLTKPDTGQHRSATVPMLVVASGAIGSTLLYAGVGALVGDTAVRHVGLAGMLLSATLYDLLLAPFTVPLVMSLARRTAQDPLADAAAGTAKGGDGAYGLLGSATGLRTSFRTGRSGRNGKPARIGGQRSVLLGRGPRTKATRIKGVKRL
ncbi:rod shape-determining protein MreD [Streptomyces sp. JJ36]|uniref:rod shape-determining protein MreD n=1 Tax=Streptomyces sp. JJ36 TaxID=2736645 RepID=UPI001F0176F0|nr:rod shape-determining protein MreD [Streptomyces sp. JJ36]MCF6525335.1 rod shape-determining protein MreD [Streptomyces sp. JJ36]